MKISVIVTFYNLRDYVRGCLDSVLGQDFDDFEVIVVDDGSTDGTGAAVQDYIDSYEGTHPIKYIYRANAGVSAARNVGFSESSGDYVMFVDGDDELGFVETCSESGELDKIGDSGRTGGSKVGILSVLYDAAVRRKPADIVMCSCTAFDEDEEWECHFFDGNRDFSRDKTRPLLQLMNGALFQTGKVITACGVPWGKLYRRRFLIDRGLRFDEQLRRMEDNVFCMNAFMEANVLYYIDEPLYRYRLSHTLSYASAYYSPDVYRLMLDRREKFISEYRDRLPAHFTDEYKCEIVRCLYMSLKNVVSTCDRRIAPGRMREIAADDRYRNAEWFRTGVEPGFKVFMLLVRLRLWHILCMLLKRI